MTDVEELQLCRSIQQLKTLARPAEAPFSLTATQSFSQNWRHVFGRCHWTVDSDVFGIMYVFGGLYIGSCHWTVDVFGSCIRVMCLVYVYIFGGLYLDQGHC